MTASDEQNTLRSRFPRIRVGRALVDSCSFAEALDVITGHAALGGAPACIVTPNAQHIALLESDARLREAYSQAELVVPDGASLLLASRLLGEKLCQRIAGVDLFEQLCGRAAELGLRVFLLGGRPGSAQGAASKLMQRFPRLTIVGTRCPPPGFEHDQRELRAVGDGICAARPELVFVALGAPKQEAWMHQHGRCLNVPVLVGVGGSFEIIAGVCRRAPRFLQRVGCEWVYRLLHEPSRLWRRYLICNCKFVWIVLQQVIGRHRVTSLHVRSSEAVREEQVRG